ncbi:GNAT family N-acetyltransferase [Cytophaga sp. FL35]|uniref:GNAT family N-acetyltransferase n=1 Tax=Cytophaga sp. FL35 TaxID=1904456 RepID=UPI001653871E|nr:GNAT family N-acetyltransferase [Cytophaga sp. FL35]MBC6999359.1 N-acetyltransferase [Cytophaga sp. FL35]
MEIVSMKAEHWPAVSNIYQEGIATGIATFETQIPTYEVWDSSHMKSCRLVAIANTEILGWAALSPVSSRCVYGGVGEVSVYVSQKARGKGVGVKLMQKLIAESEAKGLWTLQSGIFPENVSSRRLHEKMGFRFLGTRERIGKKDGEWKDNVLYERRSKTVGLD